MEERETANVLIIYTSMMITNADSRRETEYNGTLDTSLEGQAYLQTHPEMWKYYGEDSLGGDYKSGQSASRSAGTSTIIENGPYDQMRSGRLSESVLPLARASDSNGQIEYRSSAGSPYGSSNLPTYGIPLSSQPELTEDVKYPMYHTVRKHGKFQPPPPQLDINVPITVNRRGRLDEGRPVTNPDGVGASAIWRDYYNSPPDTKHSVSNKSPYNVPPEDLAAMEYGYEMQERNPGTLNSPLYSQWNGNKRQSNDYGFQKRGKRHIGPHDMGGIQRLISTG